MNKNSFMKALCMIDEDLLLEANAPNIDIITNEETDLEYSENQPEIIVAGVDVCHRFTWNKLLSVAMSMIIIVGTAAIGGKLYSQLKNRNSFECNATGEVSPNNTSNSFAPIAITDDFKGPILGVENWHIEKKTKEILYECVSFINDDTNDIFACYISDINLNDKDPTSYLADLNNDGNLELICNTYGPGGNDYFAYAQIFRLRNGIIECGRYIDDYETFAKENGLITSANAYIKDFYYGYSSSGSSLYVNYYYDKYYPDRNAIILKSKYDDEEYELDYERFIFSPVNNSSSNSYVNTISYPIKIDEYYQGPILGVKNWHIEKEGVSSDIEIIRIIDDTNGTLIADSVGYRDRTNFYLTDLDNDGIPEMVCNYQYIDNQSVMYERVAIFKENDKGTFARGIFNGIFEEKPNIETTIFEEYNEVYIPEQNKIILKKQGIETEYDLSLEDYQFATTYDRIYMSWNNNLY